jgi:WS/DGAT/MGAT family acyltransferase
MQAHTTSQRSGVGRLSRRLSAQDATFYYLETPEAPMNIGSVAIFEGHIPYRRFVQSIQSRMHLIPRYRQRVVEAPFNVGRPTWEFDPQFDIRRHIIRVPLPAPGTDAQLRELTAQLFRGQLDRSKPLWELYFVEGLEGERTALVSKIHHCLVDGVSGIELMTVMMDVSPNPAPVIPPASQSDPEPPSRYQLFFDALFDSVSEALDRAADFQLMLADALPGSQRERIRKVAKGLRAAFPYVTRARDKMAFNGDFSGERVLAWAEIPFHETRAVRKAHCGTVNDVALTVLAGALAHYAEARGEPTEGRTARVLCPVNVRREDERGALGNRVSMLLVELPLDVDDPVRRLELITERTTALKRDAVAEGVEAVADLLGGLPPLAMAALAALPGPPNTIANMVCTNVPGPLIPLYSVGHRLIAHYPMVPIAWSMGIGCAVTSYDQSLYFGLVADRQAAPDVDLLREGTEQAWLQLSKASGLETVSAELETVETERLVLAPDPRRPHKAGAGMEILAPALSYRGFSPSVFVSRPSVTIPQRSRWTFTLTCSEAAVSGS